MVALDPMPGYLGPPVVGLGQGIELLLARRVPQHQPHLGFNSCRVSHNL